MTKIVWPCGWVCQAVRAPGVKCTLRGGEGGGRLGGGDGVDVDVAGEPVGGALLGVDAAAGDLHVGASAVRSGGARRRPRRACSVVACARPRGPSAPRRLRVAAVLVAVGGVDGVVVPSSPALDELDVLLDATGADAGGVAGLRGAEPAAVRSAPGADRTGRRRPARTQIGTARSQRSVSSRAERSEAPRRRRSAPVSSGSRPSVTA